MTKSELIDSIRAIVREEVKTQLPNLIVEILAEKVASTKTNISENRQQSTQVNSTQARRPAPIINVKNPILRAVLNETVGGIPPDAAASPLVSRAIIPKELISENKDVAAVDQAMKRDYRGLLKAMDKKRGSSSLNFQASPPTSFDQDPS